MMAPSTAKGRKESVDVEFHGDMRLVPLEAQDAEYIGRFTHGTLEWIRPVADVPRVRWTLHPPDPPPE